MAGACPPREQINFNNIIGADSTSALFRGHMMYDDVQNEETKEVNLVKSAFDNNMAMINDSDMETQDKFAALGYVTDTIAELTEKVIFDKDT